MKLKWHAITQAEGSEEGGKSLGWQGATGEAVPNESSVKWHDARYNDGLEWSAEKRRRILPSASRRRMSVERAAGKTGSHQTRMCSTLRIRFNIGQTPFHAGAGAGQSREMWYARWWLCFADLGMVVCTRALLAGAGTTTRLLADWPQYSDKPFLYPVDGVLSRSFRAPCPHQ